MDCNSQAMSNVNIASGTIDTTTITKSDITVGIGKTLDVASGTLTLANDQISGDKVEGGTIGSITISQLAGAMDCNSKAMSNVNIDSGAIDGTTIGANIQANGNIYRYNCYRKNKYRRIIGFNVRCSWRHISFRFSNIWRII